MERYIFFQTFLAANFSFLRESELPDFFEDKSQILCDAHNTEKKCWKWSNFGTLKIRFAINKSVIFHFWTPSRVYTSSIVYNFRGFLYRFANRKFKRSVFYIFWKNTWNFNISSDNASKYSGRSAAFHLISNFLINLTGIPYCFHRFFWNFW